MREVLRTLREPNIRWANALASSPPFLVAGLLLVWASHGGGYSPTAWYPGLLFVEGLGVAVFGGAPWLRRELSRAQAVALGAAGALALWSFASIAWAQVRGDALDGANRALLGFVVFALFVAWRWTERSLDALVVVLALGMSVVGLVAVENAVDAADPASAFISGRLANPTGYPNANAALYLAVFWPIVHLAGVRGRPVVLRAVCGGTAALLLLLGLLPQSRGAVYTLPLVTVLYLSWTRDRWHRALLLALLGLVTYAASGAVFAVYRSGNTTPALVHSLAHARTTAIVAAAAFALCTAAFALVDARRPVPSRLVAVISRLATLVVVVGVVAAVVAYGTHRSATHDARAAWRSFTSGGEPQGGSRLHGLGSNRYDFWRVSLKSFGDHPIAGTGADNFAVAYLRHRRSGEEPLYPHSLEMQVASGLGVVGLLLFAVFIVAVGRSILTRRTELASVVGVATGFVYLLVHGSVDWLWNFPALGGLAFGLAGAAAGGAATAPAPRRSARQPRARRWAARTALGAGAVAAILAAAVPLFAQVQIERATATWRADPGRALRLLEDAATVDVFSERPNLIEGVIARRAGSHVEAERAFADAVRRNPYNWYGWLQFSLQAWALGERQRALGAVARAHDLDPRERVISSIEAGMRGGHPRSARWVDAVLASRIGHLAVAG